MKKASLLASTGLFPFVVFAQPADLLNNFLNETKQASGAFEQQTFQKDGKPAEELQEGTFSFSRPGKFVWTYTSPYPQRMVCDGSRIYIWDEDLNQVTVRSAKGAIPKSPASILFGTQSYKKQKQGIDIKNVSTISPFGNALFNAASSGEFPGPWWRICY